MTPAVKNMLYGVGGSLLLESEITRQRVIRECVVDPTKKTCK